MYASVDKSCFPLDFNVNELISEKKKKKIAIEVGICRVQTNKYVSSAITTQQIL